MSTPVKASLGGWGSKGWSPFIPTVTPPQPYVCQDGKRRSMSMEDAFTVRDAIEHAANLSPMTKRQRQALAAVLHHTVRWSMTSVEATTSYVAPYSGLSDSHFGTEVKALVQMGFLRYETAKDRTKAAGKRRQARWEIVIPEGWERFRTGVWFSDHSPKIGESSLDHSPKIGDHDSPKIGECSLSEDRSTIGGTQIGGTPTERGSGDASFSVSASSVGTNSLSASDEKRKGQGTYTATNCSGHSFGATTAERAEYVAQVFEAMAAEIVPGIWLGKGTVKEVQHRVRPLLEQGCPEAVIFTALGFQAQQGLGRLRYLDEDARRLSSQIDRDGLTSEQVAMAAGARLAASQEAGKGLSARERARAQKQAQDLSLDEMQALADAEGLTLSEWGRKRLLAATA